MEIKTIDAFISYYERTRKITSAVVSVIPADAVDWTYHQGKFSIGDLVRHIAAIERYLFMEVVQGRKPAYHGCGKELADGLDNIIRFFNDRHEESIAILRNMSDDDLVKDVSTLNGRTTSAGNFLRALIVHEIHHRGALCIYLNMIGVKTPPVIGLMEEEVIALSK